MQIDIRIAEIAVVEPHRIDVYLRIHFRRGEERGYIRPSGEQTVEHDGLHRQEEGHDIARLQFEQVHLDRILRPAGRHSVGAYMLSASRKSEMVHLQRGVRGAIDDPALVQGIEGVPQQERARLEVHLDKRLSVVLREMGNELNVSAIVAGTLCRQQRLQPLFIGQVVAQRTLQFARRQFLPSLRQQLRHMRLLTHGQMGHHRVTERQHGYNRVHLHRLRRDRERQPRAVGTGMP